MNPNLSKQDIEELRRLRDEPGICNIYKFPNLGSEKLVETDPDNPKKMRVSSLGLEWLKTQGL